MVVRDPKKHIKEKKKERCAIEEAAVVEVGWGRLPDGGKSVGLVD